MKFEMVEKRKGREITTRSDDVFSLLHEMAGALSPRVGSLGSLPKLSGARGEIEIGIEGGSQILLRVLP